jgi:hypothetical protein
MNILSHIILFSFSFGRKNHQIPKNKFEKKSPHFYLDLGEGRGLFVLAFKLFGQVIETCFHLMRNPSWDSPIRHKQHEKFEKKHPKKKKKKTTLI